MTGQRYWSIRIRPIGRGGGIRTRDPLAPSHREGTVWGRRAPVGRAERARLARYARGAVAAAWGLSGARDPARDPA